MPPRPASPPPGPEPELRRKPREIDLPTRPRRADPPASREFVAPAPDDPIAAPPRREVQPRPEAQPAPPVASEPSAALRTETDPLSTDPLSTDLLPEDVYRIADGREVRDTAWTRLAGRVRSALTSPPAKQETAARPGTATAPRPRPCPRGHGGARLDQGRSRQDHAHAHPRRHAGRLPALRRAGRRRRPRVGHRRRQHAAERPARRDADRRPGRARPDQLARRPGALPASRCPAARSCWPARPIPQEIERPGLEDMQPCSSCCGASSR